MRSNLLLLSRRWLSNSYALCDDLKESLKKAEHWVSSLSAESIPLRLFSVRYDRSSGPGGQNVNKVNSKCTLVLFNFSSCSWIPDYVRKVLKEKGIRYYAKGSDSLVIQSDESRSRESNKQICLEKLVNEIKLTCRFPKETTKETVKKWDSIKKEANESRIRHKKYNSGKKKLRGNNSFTY